MRDIAKNIKRLRREKGLTQDELAEKLHVTRQAVSNWENDKNQPDLEVLKNLAEVLGVDIKEILYEPEPVRGRRRKLIIAAIFWALTIAVLLCYPPLLRRAQEWAGMTYIVKWVTLCSAVLRPLRFFLLGMSIAATLAVLGKADFVKTQLKVLFLTLAALFLISYTVLNLLAFMSAGIISDAWRYSFYRVWAFWLANFDWTFLFPGLLLFLGWPRKAG